MTRLVEKWGTNNKENKINKTYDPGYAPNELIWGTLNGRMIDCLSLEFFIAAQWNYGKITFS